MIICASAYNISPAVFLNSAQTLLSSWDLLVCCFKAMVFGSLIAIVGSNWGLSTSGGAKGVGRSTTDAVVTALLGVFVTNFLISWLLFQGPGSALSRAL
jgi:phospholipid/cholesterol/gamma-HCH transport system permease protein